jgi:hypothetical protein
MTTSESLYLLRFWGKDEQAVAALCPADSVGREPSDAPGDKGACYRRFPTAQERERFLDEIRLSGLWVVTDIADGPDTLTRLVAHLTFAYRGKLWKVQSAFGYGYSEESARYMFEDGNYACDCNRSLFIRWQHGEDAIPELSCGHQIETLELRTERVP